MITAVLLSPYTPVLNEPPEDGQRCSISGFLGGMGMEIFPLKYLGMCWKKKWGECKVPTIPMVVSSGLHSQVPQFSNLYGVSMEPRIFRSQVLTRATQADLIVFSGLPLRLLPSTRYCTYSILQVPEKRFWNLISQYATISPQLYCSSQGCPHLDALGTYPILLRPHSHALAGTPFTCTVTCRMSKPTALM